MKFLSFLLIFFIQTTIAFGADAPGKAKGRRGRSEIDKKIERNTSFQSKEGLLRLSKILNLKAENLGAFFGKVKMEKDFDKLAWISLVGQAMKKPKNEADRIEHEMDVKIISSIIRARSHGYITSGKSSFLHETQVAELFAKWDTQDFKTRQGKWNYADIVEKVAEKAEFEERTNNGRKADLDILLTASAGNIHVRELLGGAPRSPHPQELKKTSFEIKFEKLTLERPRPYEETKQESLQVAKSTIIQRLENKDRWVELIQQMIRANKITLREAEAFFDLKLTQVEKDTLNEILKNEIPKEKGDRFYANSYASSSLATYMRLRISPLGESLPFTIQDLKTIFRLGGDGPSGANYILDQKVLKPISSALYTDPQMKIITKEDYQNYLKVNDIASIAENLQNQFESYRADRDYD